MFLPVLLRISKVHTGECLAPDSFLLLPSKDHLLLLLLLPFVFTPRIKTASSSSSSPSSCSSSSSLWCCVRIHHVWSFVCLLSSHHCNHSAHSTSIMTRTSHLTPSLNYIKHHSPYTPQPTHVPLLTPTRYMELTPQQHHRCNYVVPLAAPPPVPPPPPPPLPPCYCSTV